MNASEFVFVQEIRLALNLGLENLPEPTRDKLASARLAAVKRKKKSSPLHAWAAQIVGGNNMGYVVRHPSSWPGEMRLAVSLFILVAGLIGISKYQSEQQLLSETAEMETQIIGDELPLTAYLDKGFNTYLDKPEN